MGIAGRYIGRLINWSVNKSKTGTINFTVEGILEKKLNDPDCNEIFPDPIIGYLTLVSKEGNPVLRQIESLKSALKWDGLSLKTLNDGNYSELMVKLVVETNDNGDPRIEWVENPDDKTFFKANKKAVDEMDLLFQQAMNPGADDVFTY